MSGHPLVKLGWEIFEQNRKQAEARPGGPSRDLDECPHNFVLWCCMNRQIPVERVDEIPKRIRKRLGGFEIERLAATSLDEYREIFAAEKLHRYNDIMAEVWFRAVRRIVTQYGGDASRIWAGRPTSAEVVRRFLEFEGVGVKIATMAANILARDYRVPMADLRGIEVSPDVHVRRVLGRMGLTAPDASIAESLAAARRLSPDYPGVIDLPLWLIGRDRCRPDRPDCGACPAREACPTGRGETADAAGPAAASSISPSTDNEEDFMDYEDLLNQAEQGDEMALAELRGAAKAGEANAQFHWGVACHRGIGREPDSEEAAQWWRKAAEAGQANAQFYMGVVCFKGLGTDKDDAAAVQWWRRAASEGHVNARYNLGWMYFKGAGVPQDRDQARNWWRKAAAQGHEQAKKALARLEQAAAEGKGADDAAEDLAPQEPKGFERVRLGGEEDYFRLKAEEGVPEANLALLRKLHEDFRLLFRDFVSYEYSRGEIFLKVVHCKNKRAGSLLRIKPTMRRSLSYNLAPLYGYHKLHSLPVGDGLDAKLPAFFRELKDGYNQMADEAHQLGPRALGRLKKGE